MTSVAQPPMGSSAESTSAMETRAKGFAVRALAFVIDQLLWLGIFLASAFVSILLLYFPLYLLAALEGRETLPEISEQSGPGYLVCLLLFTAYFILFEWLYGATPGKAILRMRVVRDDGGPCTFKRALIRGLCRFIDGLFLGLIAYLQMKRPLRQRLGDRMAGTLVVRSRDPIIRNHRSAWRFVAATGAFFVLSGLINGAYFLAAIRLE